MSRVLVARQCPISGVAAASCQDHAVCPRAIRDLPGYAITHDGRVLSRHRRGTRELGPWRELRPSRDAKGYLGLTLCDVRTGDRFKLRVHRLVAEAFVLNPDRLPVARHLDGDKANNRATNLAWGTYLDNEEDKRAHGTYDLRRNGTLTLALANEVRRRYANGERQADLAREYGVSRSTITRVCNGSIWR